MWLLRRVSGHSLEPFIMDGQLVLASQERQPRLNGLAIARWRDREVIKFVTQIRPDRVYLSGGDIRHDLGWVKRAAVRARVLWPRARLAAARLEIHG